MDYLLDFIKKYEDGVTEEQILIMNPDITKEVLVKKLNLFIKENNITIYKKNNIIYYKSISGSSDNYESLLLNLISQSGTDGMWIKEIKDKTNMPHNLVMKVLKNMENKRLIKSMKCVKNNRRVYVLFDLIPSDDVTGGFWFVDNDIDVECVENISKVVLNYIKQTTYLDEPDCLNSYSNNISLFDISDYIDTLNILNSSLKECDLRTLVDTLVYDGKVEKLMDGGIERYRILK